MQAEIIDPALKGTLNVLTSCAKVASVKRVVFTSSTAAVVYNGNPLTPDTVVDETWFSDPKFCEDSKVLLNIDGIYSLLKIAHNNRSSALLLVVYHFLKAWYMLSKTLAEKATTEFAQDNKIELVVLNPGLVIGPLLQPTMNSSVQVLFDIVKGISPSATYSYMTFSLLVIQTCKSSFERSSPTMLIMVLLNHFS